MTKEQFDPFAPCQTKDGRKVAIVPTFRGFVAGFKFPLIGIVEGDTEFTTWTEQGKIFEHGEESISDLVNIEVTL